MTTFSNHHGDSVTVTCAPPRRRFVATPEDDCANGGMDVMSVGAATTKHRTRVLEYSCAFSFFVFRLSFFPFFFSLFVLVCGVVVLAFAAVLVALVFYSLTG